MRIHQVLLTLSLLLISSHSLADFYRYQDSSGNLVVAYKLTSEAIQQGYEVINSQGLVVATVAPAKTEDDLAKERSEAEQREYDLRLLMTYGDLQELIDAVARRESALLGDIALLQSKLEDSRQSLRATENRAGLEERQDGEVSEATQAALEQFRHQIETQRIEIATLELSREESIKENQLEIARLRELLGED